MRRIGLVQAAQAAALSVLLTAVWWVLIPLAPQPVCCDAGEYLRMAEDPGDPVIRPYSTRVLVPWLVHALGGDVVTSFQAVSLGCLALACWLVYLLARELGVPHPWALLALVGLASSRGWGYFLHNPYLAEPAAFLLLAAVFVVLVGNRHRWLLAPLLVLGVATREQFIGLALPLYAWLREPPLDRRALAATAGLLLAALAAFVALVLWAPTLPPTRMSQPMGLAYTLQRRMEGDGWLWFGSAFAMSLGVWWPLAAASLHVERFGRLAWWLVPVLAYLVVVGWDWARYATYAFPAVMPAGAWTIARWPRHRPLLVALVALQALVPLADVAAGKPTLDDPGPSLPLSMLLMGATIAVLLHGRRERVGAPAQVASAALAGPPRAKRR